MTPSPDSAILQTGSGGSIRGSGKREPMHNRPWLLVWLVVAAIVYGSLFPFAFHIPPADTGVFGSFLENWSKPPQSRGDLLANILFYLPLGFALGSALSDRINSKAALFLIIAAGATLSLTMELLQHFDAGRVSTMSDFYLNTIGTGAGGLTGLTAGRQILAMRLVPRDASLFAGLLLVAWLGWRLFPYEPVIDLHKYWASVKPVVLTPSLDAYNLFRFASMWGVVGYLVQYGLKVPRPMFMIALGMMGVFFAKMLIIDQVTTLPEIVGAIVAWLYLTVVLKSHRTLGTRVLAALVLLAIVLERILPLEVATTARPFEWVPFFSFLHGSLAMNVQTFMQKVFLYGAGLNLLTDSGLGLVSAGILEGAIVLTTSLLETLFAGRSAEITDTMMVLLLALVAYILTAGRKTRPTESRLI
jgi:VanZ family protein